MKLFSMLVVMVASSLGFASEAPRFSAFAAGDELYVTVLADSCNTLSGQLVVADFCKEDRLEKNLAPMCSAEVLIRSTLMGCNDKRKVARVVTMSLKAQNVAHEAEILKLTYDGQEIEVRR